MSAALVPVSGTRIGSLFSGIDGLALGVQFATLGTVAWHAEIDPQGSQILARHWPSASNLGDITRIVWGWHMRVDILVGGFPCQDISQAGKGEGIDGARSGLWREIVRCICALRPGAVFVENVAALLVRGFARVASDLAACGYRFAWSSYSSAAVGAPHRRERIFILATPDHDGERGGPSIAPRLAGQGAEPNSALAGCEGADATQGAERQSLQPTADGHQDGRKRVAKGGPRPRLASGHNADGCEPGARKVPRGNRAVGEGHRPPGATHSRLNPDFVEWMMGFPPGWTAGVSRRARLRLLGNAVQPQVAEAAFVGLLGRLGEVKP